LSRMAASGNTIKPGIIVMEPKKEAKRIPVNLFSKPRYPEMTIAGIKNRTIETNTSIIRKAGRMLMNRL